MIFKRTTRVMCVLLSVGSYEARSDESVYMELITTISHPAIGETLRASYENCRQLRTQMEALNSSHDKYDQQNYQSRKASLLRDGFDLEAELTPPRKWALFSVADVKERYTRKTYQSQSVTYKHKLLWDGTCRIKTIEHSEYGPLVSVEDDPTLPSSHAEDSLAALPERVQCEVAKRLLTDGKKRNAIGVTSQNPCDMKHETLVEVVSKLGVSKVLDRTCDVYGLTQTPDTLQMCVWNDVDPEIRRIAEKVPVVLSRRFRQSNGWHETAVNQIIIAGQIPVTAEVTP
jgi:hypothetical protein